jgi:phosphomannomutase/phosphoglucomutase
MTAKHPLSTNPWKPCDLRGVFPDAVSPQLFRAIGGAIGTMLAPGSRVVVAGDFRLSTLELKSALAEGLTETGVDVLDAGQLPTPLAYFAASGADADAVLIVTASHNPAAHNGLKLMLSGLPTTPEQLSAIRALAESKRFRTGLPSGSREAIDPLPAYLETALERWGHLREGAQPKAILDAGNGAWSEIAPDIFRRLGFEVDCISCVADGNFPDRSPDCSRASNLTQLRAAVARQEGCVGIAWDGDGDRVSFVDEEGVFVSPDEIALLLTHAVLDEMKDTANGGIVVDVKCSDLVRRAVESNRGTALLERTGHAFMRGRMVAEQALLGLDACGHYFFRELEGGDDGLFAALFVLDLLQRKGQSLAQLRRELPRIFAMPELRIPTHLLTYKRAADALVAAFPEASLMEIDGLRFVLEDGVVLVRESGTEPVLSLRIEGFDAASHERILSQCMTSLPEVEALVRSELQESTAHRFHD